MNSIVKSYFHKPTFTWTHLLYCKNTMKAALIDPVLDYSVAGAKTSTEFTDSILEDIKELSLNLIWVLETHAHADHITSASYLSSLGDVKVAIGSGIQSVQSTFKKIYNLDDEFPCDGSQFDLLLNDGDSLALGDLEVKALHTPGHTNDSMTYVVDDKAFIGDTMFAPEYGTARCDFPGGDASQLFDSIKKIYALGDEVTLYLCHDYPDSSRSELPSFTVRQQRENNVHINNTVSREKYIEMRTGRDAKLNPPALIIPSIQLNINSGKLPDVEENGISYLKFPLNTFEK